jgi:hypothetical protein
MRAMVTPSHVYQYVDSTRQGNPNKTPKLGYGRYNIMPEDGCEVVLYDEVLVLGVGSIAICSIEV